MIFMAIEQQIDVRDITLIVVHEIHEDVAVVVLLLV